MNCLAQVKFLDALNQPIQGLAHQFWIGNTLISNYVTLANGESVWIKRPVGVIVDVRIKSSTTGTYQSKVKIQLVGEKTIFIIRSPKVLLKGIGLTVKEITTGDYLRSTYIVAEGDYLSRIANDQNTTTAELIRINQLSSDTNIHPGQILKIPPQPTLTHNSAPSIQQQASQNKIETPIAKVKSQPVILLRNSERNEQAIAKLHPQVKDKVRNFINEVYKTHQIQLIIVQDYRTYIEQNAIYAKGRTQPGKVITKAKGGQSNHNFALAIDVLPIWEDGKLHTTEQGADEKNIRILIQIAPIAKKNGLAWGGDWKSLYDPMHFEFNTGLTMAQLRQAVAKVGGDPLKVQYTET